MFITWSETLRNSFSDVWAGVVAFVPNLVVAVVILIIGWAIGTLLERVIVQIVRSAKVDNALRNAKVEGFLKRAGFNLDSGLFLGGLVKWFVIVVFLVASLDVLGLKQVNAFLQEVVLVYLPQVIVAVLILLVAALIAEVMEKLVVGTSSAINLRHAKLLGAVTRWSIWIFALLMALYQLGIATPFVQTLFTGLVIALSLAFGLSFGLGGQEAAARFIEKIKSDISHKHEGQ